MHSTACVTFVMARADSEKNIGTGRTDHHGTQSRNHMSLRVGMVTHVAWMRRTRGRMLARACSWACYGVFGFQKSRAHFGRGIVCAYILLAGCRVQSRACAWACSRACGWCQGRACGHARVRAVVGKGVRVGMLTCGRLPARACAWACSRADGCGQGRARGHARTLAVLGKDMRADELVWTTSLVRFSALENFFGY